MTCHQSFYVEILKRAQIDDSSWNARVCSQPNGVYFQTTYAADYIEKTFADRCHFCEVRDSAGTTVGQALLLERKADLGHRESFARLSKVASALNTEIQCVYGPIFFGITNVREAYKAFLEGIRKLLTRSGASLLRITPPIGQDELLGCSEIGNDTLYVGFERSDRSTVIRHTLEIDESTFPGEVRTKVRKAQRLGLNIQECCSESDFQEFCKVLKESSQHLGTERYHVPSRYRYMFDVERPHDRAKFWISRFGNETLSAQMAYYFNGIVFLGGVAISEYGRLHKNLPGNDFMQYSIINWANQTGQRAIDWMGLSETSSLEGANRFKLKWGDKVTFKTCQLRNTSLQSVTKKLLFDTIRALARIGSGIR